MREGASIDSEAAGLQPVRVCVRVRVYAWMCDERVHCRTLAEPQALCVRVHVRLHPHRSSQLALSHALLLSRSWPVAGGRAGSCVRA